MDDSPGERRVVVTGVSPDEFELIRDAIANAIPGVTVEASQESVDDYRRTQRLADATPARIAYLNEERRYAVVNASYAGELPAPEALIGETVENAFPDLYPSIRPFLDAAYAGEEVHFEQKVPMKNAGERDFDISYVPDRRPDGTVAGVFVLGVDVTERRRAENLRTQLMIDAVEDYAIFMLDPDGIVKSWNRGAHRLKGYETGEIVGKHFSTFYPEEARAEGLPEAVLEAARTRGSFSSEGWRVRKDGQRFWASVVVTAVRDSKGVLRGFGKVTRDFTERRRAEESIRALNRRLSEEIRRKDRAVEELEAFSSAVSHDLKAPLRAVDGFARMLEVKHADELDGEALRYLGRIRAGTQKMASLIEDLLRLSTITRSQLRREPVDVSALVEEVWADIARRAPERSVTFEVQPQMTTVADPDLLTRLFDNLLGNAWKFTSNTDAARIEVGLQEVDGEAAFFVRDNGAGFDPAQKDRLFKPFQRLHSQKEFHGTGIGLATVRRIVHRHGGWISATSEVGAGATFSFTLGEESSE